MTRITTTDRTRPTASDWNISVMGATWPRTLTRTPRGGSPAVGDGLGDLHRRPAQVLALDVGRDAQVTLHGAAIDLAGRDAGLHGGHVADHQVAVAADLLQRQRLHLLGPVHALQGDLDLDLVIDPAARVAPVVLGHVAAGRRAHQERVGNVLDRSRR